MIGIAFPQYVIGREDEASFLGQMEYAVTTSRFDRLFVGIKDSSGRLYYPSLRYRNKVACNLLTSELVERCRDNNKEVIATIRCYDDDSVPSPGMCSVTYNGAIKSNRVCPSSTEYNEYLAGIATELVTESRVRNIHLSYFRFESLSQCYCERCLNAFAMELGCKGLPRSDILRDPAVFLRWIQWRSDTICGALQAIGAELKSVACETHLSVEMDIDYTKEYLLGVKIEEGLDLGRVCASIDELLVHVQPRGWPTSSSSLGDPFEGTTKIIRLTNGILRSKRVVSTLFFWNLTDYSSVLKAMLLLERCGSDGVVLYHDRPRVLSKWLVRLGRTQ